MCDNFEFEDDDDELLLNIVCTPPEVNVSVVKRPSETSNESSSLKKPKLNDHPTQTRLSPSLFENSDTSSSPTAAANTSTNHAQYSGKRLFPGPAGIFSDSQIQVCSQNTSTIFNDGPWQEMSKDFRIDETLCLYDKFNIAWLKKEAATNQFASQKAPFLAATLMALEVSDVQMQKCVNITLKDMTGTIQGNILQSLYEEYASHFTLGSILILVQFGVLSCTCDKCDNHHLTITPKNLGAIYNREGKVAIKQIQPQDVLTDFYQRKQELNAKKAELPKLAVSTSGICNFGLSNKRDLAKDSNMNRSDNIYKKKFTFQKTPSLKLSANRLDLHESACNSPNISESEGPSSKLNESEGPLSKPNNEDTREEGSSKKLFTFRKVNFSENSSSSNNTKVTESLISVRVDNKEHEKLWKDALDDVDINSFFDEDF